MVGNGGSRSEFAAPGDLCVLCLLEVDSEHAVCRSHKPLVNVIYRKCGWFKFQLLLETLIEVFNIFCLWFGHLGVVCFALEGKQLQNRWLVVASVFPMCLICSGSVQ